MYSTVCGGVVWWLFLGWLVIEGSCLSPQGQSMPMGAEERHALKEEAREMFYHAYNSYMDNAFPADELMPLSCRGRWRDSEPSRGDIDDALGNFTLTLVDTLDMLVVLGDIEEFDRAVRLIIRHVSFDHDIIVSVFETNIRMVGGLISAHVLAEHLNQLYGSLNWYRGELLTMAQDIASRLLPAFNTTTGIPHARVNLKYGMKSPKLQSSRETCTACAGTIILEFAALSRLTGNAVFEEKARQALDYLWGQRHRGSDLVGTVLNVHSGDWVRRDSGVGAGIDSYYEYLLKAYVLLGDESYLERFNKHYQAVMKYVSQGPMLLDVHMHRPHTTARNFMDALLAFWPGLQVLKGDIKPAIETHEMLFQVIQRHNFLPEAFTTDFQVHWGQHPLRPEFVESTYLLHQATNDPYYLRVGEQVLRSLQKHAWVPCGYAAVKDVRTGGHEDRMDSFVLTETFKYLYLLFSDPSDLIIDMDEFVFTTEAHLLPLSLARLSNLTAVPLREGQEEASDQDVEYSRSCPNAHFLFPGHHEFAATIRQPLKNFVNNVCPSRKTLKRKLRASEFQAGNSGHMGLLRDMGIAIMALPDGRVQLLHTSSNAKSSEDAEEGLMFMQEMIELSKMQQEQPDNPPRMVSFVRWGPDGKASTTVIRAGPAQFGLDLKDNIEVKGVAVIAAPIKACEDLTNGEELLGKVVIMERGDCMFIDKARKIEALGAVGGIVLDNNEGTSAASSPMFAMSGDGTDDVNIPLVFLFSADAQVLLQALGEGENLEVILADYGELDTGEGSIEEVDIDIDSSGSGNLGTSTKITPPTPNIPSILTNRQQVGPEGPQLKRPPGPQTDDLVTLQDTSKISVEPQAEWEADMKATRQSLDDAQTAEEILTAALRFVNLRTEQDSASDALVSPTSLINELQTLLIKKTAHDPMLLHALLSVHLTDLMAIMQKVAPTAVEADSSLQTMVSELGSLVHKISGKERQNDSPRVASPKKEKPSPEVKIPEETSLKENHSLEHLTEKLQEKIRKFKKKYEDLKSKSISGHISETHKFPSQDTKEEKLRKKDEL